MLEGTGNSASPLEQPQTLTWWSMRALPDLKVVIYGDWTPNWGLRGWPRCSTF